MIYAYGVTQQGHYHIKSNIVCQDAHHIVKCSDRMAIAAVADGLGSEAHSDIASKLAAEFSTSYCAERLSENSDERVILDTIKEAFTLSQQRIEKTAEDNGHELDQYDTTLSLAVLIDDTLYYGHSGDSGIVAMTTEGTFEKVTEQQRDQDGRVFPLFFGEEKWDIGKFDKSVASIFMATDGMLEILFPVYIRNETVSIYAALARYFMDPAALHASEFQEEQTQERIDHFISTIAPAQVSDDKTVVVVANLDTEIHYQAPEYYAEPNWAELKKKYDEAWRRAAYPHLYEKSEETETCQETKPVKDKNESGVEVDTDSDAKKGEKKGKGILKKLLNRVENMEQDE